MGAPRDTPANRFWRYVSKGDGCWEWSGALDRNGYGKFNDGSRIVFAHRFSFALHGMPANPAEVVRHECDNPRCVNPKHLILGTQADNVADMFKRGRQRSEASKARGSQIASSVIDEDAASRVHRARVGAPRSATGRLRRGTLGTIANQTGVSPKIISRIANGAWRHAAGGKNNG